MTTSAQPTLAAAIAPVRAALLARAQAEADRVHAEADTQAAEALAEAQQKATAIRAEARAAGEADAKATLAIDRARTQRRGRATILQARHAAYVRFQAQTRLAVTALCATPQYPELREALAQAAHGALGPSADIEEADGGGIVARAGNRRVDLSLRQLADRAVEALASELDEP